ncbi:Ulp1 protease family, carboxy-terminal catalytic domain protein [Ceratobasidium sp. AG-Ba]|nr:Ulp1 protease family, carboxy-terminal catalytic domain protein [Ceratobasidium sp. AG-Ba]QRW15173.1 Ulp1 protease family, carboxy-terminal catalytic domain protein [Ceratobasidium sp. AG-Ba]
MMMPGDRKHIATLNGVANGQAPPPAGSKKKRPLEDDRQTERGRRNAISNPYRSLAKDNLHNPSRTINREFGNLTSGIPSTSSGSYPHYPSLARAAFSSQGGSTNGRFSEVATSALSFTLADEAGSSASSGGFGAKAAGESHRLPSEGINRMMSSSGEHRTKTDSSEEQYSMETFLNAPVGELLDSPQIQQTPSLPSPLSTIKNRDRSSSDPMDLISPRVEINVDDDDDEAVEGLVQPERQPGTPTGKTTFTPGHVKNIVQQTKAKQENLSQQAITAYTQPKQKQKPSLSAASPSRQTPQSVGSPKKSQSAPVIIKPGYTRANHTGVTQKMKGKTRTPQTGLILSTVGGQSDNAHSAFKPKPNSKSADQPLQANIIPFSFGEIVFELQEWFCGGKRHDGKRGKLPYTFHYGPSSAMVSLRRPKGSVEGYPLVLMAADIEHFEIADLVDGDANSEILVPALLFTVNSNCANSSAWKRVSIHDDPRVLVVIDMENEADPSKWKQMVDRLSKECEKRIIQLSQFCPNAMNSLIKQARDQSSTKAIPFKARPRPKATTAQADDEITEYTPPMVPPTMSDGPLTRTRNKFLPKPRPRIPSPAPLPAEDLDEIMLVYPSAGPGAVNINRAELLRLGEGEFLNDTLIELGLKLWVNNLREKNPELVEQIHVFNSFFFKKLDSGRGKACDYNSVKKWTSKIDLFKKKFIIVPINEHLHWYLAIIFLPEHALSAPPPEPALQPTRKTRSSNAGVIKDDEVEASQESDVPATERDSVVDLDARSPKELGRMEIDTDLANRSQQSMTLRDTEMIDVTTIEDEKPVERLRTPVLDVEAEDFEVESQNKINGQKCWILIFDSLKGKHARTIRILREYIQAEAQERHGKLIEARDARLSGGFIEDKHLPVPEQPNWCDCGVYLLHYVEAFVANPLEIIALPGLRRKSPPEEVARYKELWRTEDVVEKRSTFRKQINDLSEAWRQSKSQLAQVSKDDPSKSGELLPGAEPASSLPNLAGELSVIEIEAPDIRRSPHELATPATPEEPVRTGELPPMPGDSRQSSQPLSFPPFEQDDSISITDTSSIGNQTRNSEELSSVSPPKVRRGKKGGERHGGQGYRRPGGTHVSQTSQIFETSQPVQSVDTSNPPGSPEL